MYGRHGVDDEMTFVSVMLVTAAAAADEAIISFHMEEHRFLMRKDRGILSIRSQRSSLLIR